MTALPLETCRLAAACGYRGEWPQTIYLQARWLDETTWIYRLADEGNVTAKFWIWQDHDGTTYECRWVAAPHAADLLSWLEAEKGWSWCRPLKDKRWWAYEDAGGIASGIYADTAADLCLAILRRLTEGA